MRSRLLQRLPWDRFNNTLTIIKKETEPGLSSMEAMDSVILYRNVQWHESGQYWDLFYQYFRWSGDLSWKSFADSQLALSAGGNGDYMGGLSPYVEETTRWNDDMCWWGLTSMTAAENGDSFHLQLATRTFEEVWMSWDASTCGGGIFWSRSRSGGYHPTLKSTITNAQMVDLGARLFRLTGNADYKNKVDQIWNWLRTVGLVSADYTVYDGVESNECVPNQQVYSYHTGELLTGMSNMYIATKDTKYLTEAHNIFASIKRQFVVNDVLSFEPSCAAGANCKSPTGYYWAIYKGLFHLSLATPDAVVQNSVASVIRTSATANFRGCNSNWNCMRNLGVGTGFTLRDGTNVRDQFETVAILNALAVINGVVPRNGSTATTFSTVSSMSTVSSTISATALPTNASNNPSNTESSSSSNVNVGIVVGSVFGGAAVFILAAGSVLLYRRRQLQNKQALPSSFFTPSQ
ncbi:hypothetical protein BCR33DRAFT_578611 [Rhizoclosmatium globosum]|uniref:Mannan endo-1,6-alpha-mannosidase n=1 Tax=Rhizoclosmatium globosum TaxID=329046 RepID=A0A1Y2B3G0_9FUNG|nr:hypothetical protein BCR33DRAFT_578611 [Rhizoclosmatium globosum]|eukprot:ORY29264.1 hypothetical protein BCR33DRAFT_578611 [Rhizoclosmatium globosum]